MPERDACELTYALVTPTRNDAANLGRLGACLAAQTVLPTEWIIVENGSSDDTAAVADSLALQLPWARALHTPGERVAVRSVPIVHAFNAGLRELRCDSDIVVKLDSDVTMASDYFARLLAAFSSEPSLGMTSGICHEKTNDGWEPLYGTRSFVWGACRAYRRACLADVLPLEEHEGWDDIDALKARLRGWKVGSINDLPLRHHRTTGTRDGTIRNWTSQGETAHYLGYRPTYLVLRALYRAWRQPRRLAMIWGFVHATAAGWSQCPDAEVRAFMRREQSPFRLGRRARESLGRDPGITAPRSPPSGGA